MAADESQFDNTTPRFAPSIPKHDEKLNVVWPAGVPDSVKESFKEYSERTAVVISTVPDFGAWYFEKCKLSKIHKNSCRTN